MDYNRTILLGRAGKDPEIKVFDGGVKKASFSLATSEKYKEKETTQWHNVIAFGTTADLMEKYLQKGNQVLIEGRLTYRDYEDKMGSRRYITEIIADKVVFLGGKKEEKKEPEIVNPPAEESSDLPF